MKLSCLTDITCYIYVTYQHTVSEMLTKIQNTTKNWQQQESTRSLLDSKKGQALPSTHEQIRQKLKTEYNSVQNEIWSNIHSKPLWSFSNERGYCWLKLEMNTLATELVTTFMWPVFLLWLSIRSENTIWQTYFRYQQIKFNLERFQKADSLSLLFSAYFWIFYFLSLKT